MVRTWPVTNDPASEQKNMTAPIRSSTSAIRPSGIRLMRLARKFSSASRFSTCGVRTNVGDIAFTVMPYFAPSTAPHRVDQDVERAELLDRLVHRRLRVFGSCHVAGHHQDIGLGARFTS